jgi:hypothetical protein
LDPIRKKYNALAADKQLLESLREGEEIARPMIRKTLDEIKSIVGFE